MADARSHLRVLTQNDQRQTGVAISQPGQRFEL